MCGDDEDACESMLVCAARSGSVQAVACLLHFTHTPQPAASSRAAAPPLGATAATALSGSGERGAGGGVGASDGGGVVGSVCVFEEVFVTRRRWRRRVRGAAYLFFFLARARPHADTHVACLCVLMLLLTIHVSACYYCYTGKRGASMQTHALPLMGVALLSCSEAIVLSLLDSYNAEVQKAMGL